MVNGSVHKTKYGKYCIRYMKDGKRISKNVNVKTLTEAKMILAELISEVDSNVYQDNVKMTFYELTKLWLEHHAEPNLSPTTVISYKSMLNNVIIPRLGDMKISDIKKIHIQDVINECREKNLTSKTQRKYLLCISSIMSYGMELDMLKFNPCSTIKIRANSMEQKKEMQIYDHNEIEMLQKALDDEPDRQLVDMILIDLYTGLRRGEIMGLMAKDYDAKERTLTISRNRISVAGVPTIKDTKNHKSRTFLLNNKCCEIFDRICEGMKEDDLLFPIHPDTFSKNFKKFLKRNNLKDIRVYDLRHTNASMLHSEGIDYATIAARIGNLPSTTANFYIHKVNEKDKKAKDVLDNIFK